MRMKLVVFKGVCQLLEKSVGEANVSAFPRPHLVQYVVHIWFNALSTNEEDERFWTCVHLNRVLAFFQPTLFCCNAYYIYINEADTFPIPYINA